ncbi:hypothetical protein PEC730217_46250 [Pectobacterium carotovorum subsp. carotovorum]|nr:Hypothetical protein SCC1_2345 [Pectobacterium versatile]RUR91292.1 hypothetical protein PB16LOC_02888 [Pectobacterium versatile]GKV83061.1 hypothetical protein PEC106664_38350 [Pectobacterium carotovorum subsp. carotovorum]GKW35845.1 hypothetical protein PEC730217_46250 [Pectobacterium carotovorum subsp. carotovorum]
MKNGQYPTLSLCQSRHDGPLCAEADIKEIAIS